MTDTQETNEFDRAKYLENLLKASEEIRGGLAQRILKQQKTIGSLTDTIDELKAHCKAVDDVNEKMKNFYNCSHSSRALCPNEHNCKGCKDWELAE